MLPALPDPDNIPENVVFTYDPSKGRFRHYLRKIVRNHAIRIYHQRHAMISIDDENSGVDQIASADQWDAMWEEEWHRHLLNMALIELKGRVQTETYVAFEMYALQNRSVQDVAEFLNISIASVYTAKSRCVAALKEIITDLEEK